MGTQFAPFRIVIPAKAGIQATSGAKSWIPAFARMTAKNELQNRALTPAARTVSP
jgi:hypothetical protein